MLMAQAMIHVLDSETFDIERLLQEQEKSGSPWLQYIKLPSLRSRLYVFAKDAIDTQTPHLEDEIYFVLSGQGKLRVEGSAKIEELEVSPGSLLFVKAGLVHKFHSIEEELRLLVFFSAPTSPS